MAVRVWLGLCVALLASACNGGTCTQLHYASNGNFSKRGTFAPGSLGFNLADVSDVAQLALLPTGVRALVWVGQCDGTTDKFVSSISPFLGREKVYGFYLMDDVDPTGKYFPLCSSDALRSESEWIHERMPSAKTFVGLMNLGSAKSPSYSLSPNPASSKVDLYGLAAYPCRSELGGCDLSVIDRYVAAAEAAGIPRGRIIPMFQTFGGGTWKTDGGGSYIPPGPEVMPAILQRWRDLVSVPEFDYAYSWGTQRSALSLATLPSLHPLFSARNAKCSTSSISKPARSTDSMLALLLSAFRR